MYCNMAFMFICSYLTLVCHIHRLATISLMSSIGETSNTIFLESQVFNKVLSESKHLSYFILLFWVYIWYGGKTLVLLPSCCSLSCLIYLGFCLQPLLYFTSKFIRMLSLLEGSLHICKTLLSQPMPLMYEYIKICKVKIFTIILLYKEVYVRTYNSRNTK